MSELRNIDESYFVENFEIPQFIKDILEDKRVKDVMNDKNWPFYKYGFLGFLAIYLIFGYGAQLICNMIGFVYPAFCSMRALESTQKEDDTRWLTYWVVFAVFSVFEFFSDILLSWFPFYWLAKCIFLAWCFIPMPWNGSDVIYNRIIRPFFMKHQREIDSTLNKVTDRIGEIAEQAQRNIKKD